MVGLSQPVGLRAAAAPSFLLSSGARGQSTLSSRGLLLQRELESAWARAGAGQGRATMLCPCLQAPGDVDSLAPSWVLVVRGSLPCVHPAWA